MAHRRFEQAQPEGALGGRVEAPARVLAREHVVLGVRHQPEHDAGLVADAGDVGDGPVRVATDVAQRDLAAAGQVALRYAGGNPNGSVADIAGVGDETGVVLGLMPHPENHVLPRQHPRHRLDPTTTRTLGLRLFEAAVRHVK